jgi:glycosyltransferase involved in cell wall biosynthesis
MLSVIITVFEQRQSLEMLLYCLKAQIVDEAYEIIVCDDGSSEDMLGIVRDSHDLSTLDIRYIWHSKKGCRAASTKNRGIRSSRGDLLVFLDADILVRPDFLQRHRAAHGEQKTIVCNPRRWVAPRGLSSDPRSSPRGNINDASTLFATLATFAKDDMRSLFEYLEKISIDIDRIGQQRSFKSLAPWRAFIGFSFSVSRSDVIYFDEAFEGWGPEDREFALRLVRKHGYIVSFREDIEVFHLEPFSTGRQPFSILPRSSTGILDYIRNMIYFRSSYPEEDLDALMMPLMAYELDSAGELWQVARSSKTPRPSSRADLNRKIEDMERWLIAHDLLRFTDRASA